MLSEEEVNMVMNQYTTDAEHIYLLLRERYPEETPEDIDAIFCILVLTLNGLLAMHLPSQDERPKMVRRVYDLLMGNDSTSPPSSP